MLEAPLYQQGNTYPARLDRQFIEDVFDVEGVLNLAAGALRVTPPAAGANMSVDIAAGRAVIKGDDEANQGSYRVISTAVENRPLGAAPASNSRIDLVVARVRDANVTGGVSSDWVIEIIPGAVAAAPVAPAVPPTAIPLAQVLVAASTVSIDAAKITDRRTAAASAAYPTKAQIAVERLAHVQLAADGAISFTSIPSGYRHLLLEILTSSTHAAADDGLFLRFNGDTGAVYDWEETTDGGSSVTAGEGIGFGYMQIGRVPAANAPAGAFAAVELTVPDYSRAFAQKVVTAASSSKTTTAAGGVQHRRNAGFWRITTVGINRIDIGGVSGALAGGSVATLYGMKDVSP